jgi:2-phospho-L-lactate guanylyltransferase
VLVLPADLPAISPAEVDALIDGAATARRTDAPLVALVTDQHGTGTNALLLSPPSVIDPLFGSASHDLHRAAAAAAGASFLELDGPLALDVDTVDDLVKAEAALGAIRG